MTENAFRLDTHFGAYLFTENRFRPDGLIGFVAKEILQAFVDASGQYQIAKDSVMTVNGCLSTPERWAAFSDEWCGYLKEHKFKPNRKQQYTFHCSPFWAGSCPQMPNNLSLADKHRIYHDLITIIRKHTVYRFGFGVLLDDFRKIEAEFPNIRDMVLKQPATRMSLLCFEGNSNWARENDYDPAIGYWFDRGHDFKEVRRSYEKALELLNAKGEESDRVRFVIPEDKAEFTPLQAADVLAWECRRNALHWQFARQMLPMNLKGLIPGMEWHPTRELLRLNKPGKSNLRFFTEEHLREEMYYQIGKTLSDEGREMLIGDRPDQPFKNIDEYIRALGFYWNEEEVKAKEARKQLAETNRQKNYEKKLAKRSGNEK